LQRLYVVRMQFAPSLAYLLYPRLRHKPDFCCHKWQVNNNKYYERINRASLQVAVIF